MPNKVRCLTLNFPFYQYQNIVKYRVSTSKPAAVSNFSKLEINTNLLLSATADATSPQYPVDHGSMQPVPDASIARKHATRSAFEDVLGQVVRADLALHVRTRDVIPLRSTSVLAADNFMIP